MNSQSDTQRSLEPIKFRQDVQSSSSSAAHWSNFGTAQFQFYFDTGYVPSSTSKQEENNQNSLIYRTLPRELVLEIMCHTTAEDLYFLRQTSRLFFLLYPRVDTLFETKTPGGPRRAQKLTGLDGPPLGPYAPFSEEILFNASLNLKATEKDLWEKQLRDRLRRDACEGCKVQDSLAVSYPGAGGLVLRCAECRIDHRFYHFSNAQLENKKNRICIAAEGRLKLCPHKSVHLVTRPSHFPPGEAMKWFECRECPEMLPGPGQDFPRITSAEEGEPAYVTWKVTVCTLTPGQVVTKALLRECLKRLLPFSDALCPHASFEDGYLLRPFDWDRCICFREPATLETEKHICGTHSPPEHDRDRVEGSLPPGKHCCACLNREKKASVGRSMADSTGLENHRVRCHRCDTEYSWTLEGDWIMLSATRDLMENAVIVGSAKSERVGLSMPEHVDRRKWIHALDPKTFEGNKYTREIHRCKRRSCISSKGLSTTCLDDFEVISRSWYGSNFTDRSGLVRG
ncbi:hypothetical protein CkaCkLH20_05301 [Colletotrichum karsti]|uniref:F-box domain-containing protein n=1 Tax=Colletotrichum karsti TaxID=1095194 RepID=A0A9P6LLB4_9PEZI|nr:uncharacterized protein CkaCkLH20_05301 [Colletotrichum karsti]KAF9877035.1 hypothetical protein CkaCkLH20_05301 [Colletotrichum karsti]